jgi:hypothetical protein
LEKKNKFFFYGAPEDQAICLFAGLLANPDMALSQEEKKGRKRREEREEKKREREERREEREEKKRKRRKERICR